MTLEKSMKTNLQEFGDVFFDEGNMICINDIFHILLKSGGKVHFYYDIC